LLAAGGAHAIAALAFGAGPVPPCDVVVGPGNRYVTAAKQLVAGRVAIDMLAGPSELVVFADSTASPAVLAADLLAQAEHDPDALPVLVTLDPTQPDRVEAELRRQLADLPSADVARAALTNGGAVVVANVEEGIVACDALAPEHLELCLRDSAAVAPRLAHYGALFIGGGSAEVLGDYGAGPNHVLPTSGRARSKGGLSVYTFLRVRTWLRIDDEAAARPLVEDAAWFARVEGLEAHARSAERRLD
jgi:phosphoribosyl-ATP pyrophosphohydrolase/phosphoribosyl-AMP cyclohydrolase/histidinol dehydrogenase